MEQNVALDRARREAETAIRARNDFLAVMNHEMRTPMHAVIALSSLLQETELTPEQRLMVETVLKSSNLLATLINDVLDLSRLEDGSLQLDASTFNLHSVFREVKSLCLKAKGLFGVHNEMENKNNKHYLNRCSHQLHRLHDANMLHQKSIFFLDKLLIKDFTTCSIWSSFTPPHRTQNCLLCPPHQRICQPFSYMFKPP